MNQYACVELINSFKYRNYGLYNNIKGVVLNTNYTSSRVCFFNENVIGDVCVVEIDNKDMKNTNIEFPKEFREELIKKIELLKDTKNSLQTIKFKENDFVELVVDSDRYSRLGLKKGDRGCVVENCVINNSILVDFSGIGDNGEIYGDCVSVKIEDIKLIEDE